MRSATVELTSRRRRFIAHSVLAGVAALGLWVLPEWFSLAPSFTRVTVLAMIYAMTVMGLNLVFGIAGQVTLGPAAVFAVGAYSAGVMNAHFHWDPFLSVLAGIGIAAAIGLVIGIPALRVSGFYLAMITALAADAVPTTAKLMPGLTGGDAGLFGMAPFKVGDHVFDRFDEYHFTLVLLVITALLVGNVARTSWGRWFAALKTSEPGASSIGVSVYRAKLVAFVMAAIFGGLAGGIYAQTELIVDPRQFTFDLSLALFSALVIGGLGSLWGPVMGAFIFVLGPYYLSPSNGSPWVNVVYGALLIGVMVVIPEGLAEAIGRGGRYAAALARAGPGARHRRDAREVESGTPPHDPAPLAARTEVLHDLMTAALRGEAGRTVLAATAVTKRFGGLTALDDASVEVRAGKITALIGPNGSGKTTLLNVCSGYLTPEAGRVFLDGRDITRVAAHRRAALGLARTFQGALVFPTLTPTQNVMAGCRIERPSPWSAMLALPRSRRHERDAAARAESLLDALGVGHLVDGGGSGSLADGRIVGLARALALDPTVLALDEPVAGLDLEEIETIRAVIAAARDSGVGILLVEHDVSFVIDLADTITVLDRGTVIFDGAADQVRDDRAVVDAYFGEPLDV
jgi:branched-chain amino acid transport system permease protein